MPSLKKRWRCLHTGRCLDDRYERRSVLAYCTSRNILYTGSQEDNRHCDAEALGVILLKFSRCLHCSAGSGCVFAERLTHGASHCDFACFVLVRCLFHRTMLCLNTITILWNINYLNIENLKYRKFAYCVRLFEYRKFAKKLYESEYYQCLYLYTEKTRRVDSRPKGTFVLKVPLAVYLNFDVLVDIVV